MIKYINNIKTSENFLNLQQEIKEGVFSHSYLFVGEDLEYIKNFVKYVSLTLLCEKNPPCETCSVCQKIISGHHVDIHEIDASLVSADVETISKLFEDIYVLPFEADKKFYIIYSAENLSEIVQNKILKTIEEPPKNTYIFLSTSNEFKLLPTISSRMRKVYMRLLGTEELKNELIKIGVEKSRAEQISILSGGNISRSESLLKLENVDGIFNIALDILLNLNSTKTLLNFANLLEKNKNNLENIYSTMLSFSRDALAVKNGKNELVNNKMYIEEITKISAFSFSVLTKIIDILLVGIKNLDYNMNITMNIDSVLLQIVEVKVKCRK